MLGSGKAPGTTSREERRTVDTSRRLGKDTLKNEPTLYACENLKMCLFT